MTAAGQVQKFSDHINSELWHSSSSGDCNRRGETSNEIVVMQFLCGICGASFKYKRNLRTHEVGFHGRQPVRKRVVHTSISFTSNS